MLLRSIIVDHDRVARQGLRRLLAAEPEVQIVAECADGFSAIKTIEARDPDLLLLDIEMPQMDGFEVLEKLRPRQLPLIVFVTSHDRHAVRAFNTRALDYLVRPLSPERLHRAINRVRNNLRLIREVSLRSGEEEARYVRRFTVRSGARTCFVAPDEIDWIESAGNYAVLHTGKRNHVLRETMSTLERELPADRFLRVSRSAIVHLTRVKELQTVARSQHCAVMDDGERVPITRSVREIQDRLRATPTLLTEV